MMRRVCGALLAAAFLWILVLTVGVQASATEETVHATYAFRVATEQEDAYLAKGASLNSSNIRYADGLNEIIYRFDMEHLVQIQQAELSGPLYQQLLLSVSTDGVHYHEVYRWTGEVAANGSGGLDCAVRTFDLTPYIKGENVSAIYIKIADSYTGGGWGGAVHPSEDVVLDVSHIPLTLEQVQAAEMAAAMRSVRAMQAQLDVLEETETMGLEEASFKTAARLVAALRRDYDALDERTRALADEHGVLRRLTAAETAVANYEARMAYVRPVPDAVIEPQETREALPLPPTVVSPADGVTSSEMEGDASEPQQNGMGATVAIVCAAVAVAIGAGGCLVRRKMKACDKKS